MVNIPNVDRLIEFISGEADDAKRLKIGFNMMTWIGRGFEDHTPNHCGTTACMGGAIAVMKLGVDGAKIVPYDDFGAIGADFLGITEKQADILFTENTSEQVTVEDAVAVLERLKATGEVDWSIVEDYDSVDDDDYGDDGDDEDYVHHEELDPEEAV